MKILKFIVVCLVSLNLLGCKSLGLKPNKVTSDEMPSLKVIKQLRQQPRRFRGGWFGINDDAKFRNLGDLVTLELLLTTPRKNGLKCEIFKVTNRTKNTIGISEREFLSPHTVSLVLDKKVIPRGGSAWLWVITDQVVSYESEY